MRLSKIKSIEEKKKEEERNHAKKDGTILTNFVL